LGNKFTKITETKPEVPGEWVGL